MLEETAQQFHGRQVHVPGLAGVALAVRPAHAAIWKQFQWAIAGGGFENVAAQIPEGFPARARRLGMDHPARLPDLVRQTPQGLGMMRLEGLVKEMAKVIAQRMDGQKEFVFGRRPVALIRAQCAPGHQVMNVRMTA